MFVYPYIHICIYIYIYIHTYIHTYIHREAAIWMPESDMYSATRVGKSFWEKKYLKKIKYSDCPAKDFHHLFYWRKIPSRIRLHFWTRYALWVR